MPEKEHYTDTDLFAETALGDEAAFAALFYRYTARLFPFVSKLLNSELWAEEIVQDTFMRLWQSREKLGRVSNPNAYIYQMAANRTLDYIRRNAQDVKLQYYIARQQTLKEDNLTEADLDFREAEALIREAIHNLPPQRRKVYQLAREQGLSHEEIARQLDISTHTVRNHVADAVKAIRLYLQEKGAITALIWWTIKNIL